MLSQFRCKVYFLILLLVLRMLFDSLICEEVEVNWFGYLAHWFLHREPWVRSRVKHTDNTKNREHKVSPFIQSFWYFYYHGSNFVHSLHTSQHLKQSSGTPIYVPYSFSTTGFEAFRSEANCNKVAQGRRIPPPSCGHSSGDRETGILLIGKAMNWL